VATDNPIANVQAAILAGGLATRLGPATANTPKALVEVAGKPFIDHQIDLLKQNGFRRLVLCLGYLGEKIEQHLGDGSRVGMQIRYSHDGPRLLGTGGALRRAFDLLDDPFFVLYGDSYMDIDYPAIFRHFQSTRALALMTVLSNHNQWDKSNVIYQNNQLLRYDKRNAVPEMTYVDYGVAILGKSALERVPPDTQYDLADLYSSLVQSREMVGYEVATRFYEIGTPASLEETRAYLAGRNK